MPHEFLVRIVGEDASEVTVAAESADEAANLATGEALTRGSQRGPIFLRAKVYWSPKAGVTNMVRFYRKVPAASS
jgi:hypothetical protein